MTAENMQPGAASGATPPGVAPEAQPAHPAPPGTPADAIAEAVAPENDGPVILATPGDFKDGVVRCEKCGASEVTYSTSTGMLTCTFCRHRWQSVRLDEAMGLSEGIGDLKGTVIASHATDIEDDGVLVTLKCSGCGSEVVIDTTHNLSARCHWCKHTLTVNNKIPNGAVPDGILPFSVSKEEAMQRIKAFVEERKSFALPEFASTFRAENVMGVYMPYMTVDGNISATLKGVGQVLRQRVTVGENQTEYRGDEYDVVRHVDLEVDDLIVEASSDKANIHSTTSTTNIINAVLPYDVKEMVRFNAGYLGSEFTSEKRDMNIDHAESYAADHFMTMARGAVIKSVAGYDRGVRWESEEVNIKGSRWTAVLLPVWLYGFDEVKRGERITHYIAVNGRTGATMGSVPINTKKAGTVSTLAAVGISLITWPIAIIMLVAGL